MSVPPKPSPSGAIQILQMTAAAGGDFVAFIVLTAWYVVAIYLVIVTLGVQQFQARIDKVTVTDAAKFASIRKWDAEYKPLAEEVRFAKTQRDKSRIEVDAAWKVAIQLTANYSRSVQLKIARPNDPKVDERLTNIKADLEAAQISHEAANVGLLKRRAALKIANQTLVDKHGELKPADRALLEKVQRIDGQRDMIKRWARFFLDMPNEWLTLILALSMGMFGSTIYVSRVFFRQSEEVITSRSWYFLRPFRGAVLALGSGSRWGGSTEGVASTS